jgi:transposase
VERNKRLYPVSEEVFNRKVLPIIEGDYIWKGRPPKVSHYQAFCGILYILRTGCPWRDLPEAYGYWHVIHDRFSRGSKRGLRAKVLLNLQREEGIVFNEVIIDSTTMKVHRYGGGRKGVAIERISGKIKENRRLTVRYEKSDINFPGFIMVAFIKILLC